MGGASALVVVLMSGTWSDHGSYLPHVWAEAAGAARKLCGCRSMTFFGAALWICSDLQTLKETLSFILKNKKQNSHWCRYILSVDWFCCHTSWRQTTTLILSQRVKVINCEKVHFYSFLLLWERETESEWERAPHTSASWFPSKRLNGIEFSDRCFLHGVLWVSDIVS